VAGTNPAHAFIVGFTMNLIHARLQLAGNAIVTKGPSAFSHEQRRDFFLQDDTHGTRFSG